MGIAKEETPKAYFLDLTENAVRNIDEIVGHIAFEKHEPLNAIIVGDKIFEKLDMIELIPLGYRECEEIPTKTKMYRKAVCMSWNVIFKIVGHQIIVLGIIHGSNRPSKVSKLKRMV